MDDSGARASRKADREERYWSRFADSYDRDGAYVVGRPILRAIEDALGEEQALGYAIEFGCGTGYFTKVIAPQAARLVATDLSDAMVEVARTELGEFDNITVEKADCADTAYSAESFDTVMMINLIHVIADPAPCLRESHRILRGGGRLILVDLTGYGMRLRKRMRLGFRYVRRWGLPPRGGQNNMAPAELASLAESAGFTVDDVQLLEDGANAVYLRGARA
jgi:SAM-dependent methyltransferase